MRLRLSASVDTSTVSARTRFAAIAALVAAGLVAIASLAGIFLPAIYARETASWRTQGIGQDWANVLVAAPWLIATAILALRGSRRGRLLLGGGLAYTSYSYVFYAFDVHFNAVFLAYCGALGLATYALAALASETAGVASWFDARVPHRLLGGFEMACAVAFALLWLSQIVPALVNGHAPAGLDEVGLFTNPAHVLDLAFVLPAMFAGGWLLWHRRPAGYAVVAILLGFSVLLGAALTAMAIVAAEPGSGIGFAVGLGSFALAGTALLAWMLWAMPGTPVVRVDARLDAI